MIEIFNEPILLYTTKGAHFALRIEDRATIKLKNKYEFKCIVILIREKSIIVQDIESDIPKTITYDDIESITKEKRYER